MIYLYVKQCTHCGLKYFGKTIREDYLKYKGSGHHWLRHVKLHGLEKIETVQVWSFDNQTFATEFALNFSNKNNIVESSEWANLILEDGKDGNSSNVITKQLRQKFIEANSGIKNPSYGKYWWTNGAEEIKSKECPAGWKRGRANTAKKLMSTAQKTKNNRAGTNNPSYGKKWWTNGVNSIKSEICPLGWYRGVGSEFRKKSSNKKSIL